MSERYEDAELGIRLEDWRQAVKELLPRDEARAVVERARNIAIARNRAQNAAHDEHVRRCSYGGWRT